MIHPTLEFYSYFVAGYGFLLLYKRLETGKFQWTRNEETAKSNNLKPYNYFELLLTENMNFYMDTTPSKLIGKYGSPLYVYNESILRQKCRDMKNLLSYPNFSVSFSAKANSNLHILEIVNGEIKIIRRRDTLEDLMRNYS